MGLPIVRIRRCALWLALWLLPAALPAQGYEISGESSLTGSVTLTIFDGDSSSRTLVDRIDKGLFYFTGSVSQPVLASISHPSMRQPLYFYLENSVISIVLNASRPEASSIKGSRTNSEYRYLMERYRSAADPGAFLRQYIQGNADAIYAPFILHSQMQTLDEGTLRQLTGLLQGAATHTYHYTLLRRWQRETPLVSEGSEMPDFSYITAQHKEARFGQMRSTEGYTLLVFGASWCDKCQQMVSRAEKAAKGKDLCVLYIRIDDSPAGWDAPYMKQLSIDHLPYAILIDRNGTVQRRDIRLWELEQIIR